MTSIGRRPAVVFVTLMTAGAGLIHFAVAPEHLAEWVWYGVFFLLIGAAQVALAALILWRPSRRLVLVALGSALGLISLWAVSRTVGVPVGPTPGRPESIGLTDVVCVATEGLACFGVVVALMHRPRRRRLPAAVAAAPAALLAGVLSAVGVSAGLSGMVVAYNVAPLVPGAAQVSVPMLTEAPGSEPLKEFTLVAQVTREGWTFGGTVPGPELRVTQGDRVRVTLVNHLPAATTIHWHGVVLPNAEDGVAGITQDAVPPGTSFVYEFVARDTGTYWYHSHQQTSDQLQRGLFGALVVLPRSGPSEARDYTLLVHNVPVTGAAAVNGVTGGVRLDAQPGETVRLRVINALIPGMDGSPEAPLLSGAAFQFAEFDGRIVPGAPVVSGARVPLGMGERADLVFTMPASGAVRLSSGALQGGASPVQAVIEKVFATPSQAWSVTIGKGAAPVEPGAAPVLDLAAYAPGALAAASPDVVVPLVLGEHPGMREGRPQLVHTINGGASPYGPVIHVHEGERVRLHVVNQTAEYHPMHLHGHELGLVGSQVTGDTVLVAPHQSTDVDFTADNPGVWMLHCHVLLHAEMGMMATVVYDGVGTPFEMGSRSGNMPE